jgi:hypothetical protein
MRGLARRGGSEHWAVIASLIEIAKLNASILKPIYAR